MAEEDELKGLSAEVERLFGTGLYAEGVAVALKSLALAERLFGPDHPDVATSLNNLAELYRAQGRYGEAEPSTSSPKLYCNASSTPTTRTSAPASTTSPASTPP